MINETKLAPIHPGETLNEEFPRIHAITRYRLAKAIGVDARRIHSVVHGERSTTAETALLLARFFGDSRASGEDCRADTILRLPETPFGTA